MDDKGNILYAILTLVVINLVFIIASHNNNMNMVESYIETRISADTFMMGKLISIECDSDSLLLLLEEDTCTNTLEK